MGGERETERERERERDRCCNMGVLVGLRKQQSIPWERHEFLRQE